MKQLSRMISVAGLLITIILLMPTNAFSSTCCAGGGGQSICVLPSEQRYQLGISSSYREVQGEFGPYGEYSRLPDGKFSRTTTTVVGAAYRISEDWQAGLSFPIVSNHHNLPGKDLSSTGAGDPALEARYTLWEDLSFLTYRPQLSFYGGMRFPLGKSVYNSSDPYSTNVIGDGTYTAHAGVNTSKIYHPFKFVLDGTFFYPFSKTVTEMRGQPVASPYTLKNGNRFQLLESGSYLVNEHWSGTLGTKQFWILPTKMNDAEVDGSASRIFSTTAGINYFHNAAWAFALSYETAFPFYKYLANQANAQLVSISAVYGGF